MTRAYPEQALQKTAAEYLTLVLLPPTWFTAFPAGGGGKRRCAILNGMGLKAGVPDLLIIHKGEAYWIELKSAKGTLNAEQKVTIPALEAADCECVICRSIVDVEAALVWWEIPTRIGRPALTTNPGPVESASPLNAGAGVAKEPRRGRGLV